MRTTLDIDPRVLAAARARVSQGISTSIGEAISQLALTGLREERGDERAHGLILLPSAGRPVTDEMVAEALLDE